MLKRFLASLVLLGAILTGGAFAQSPNVKSILFSGGSSCPASVRLASLPAQYQCPAVSLQLASGTAWVKGQGFVPLSSLLSITNASGGYVTDWSGAMTWKFGPVTNLVFPSQGNFNSSFWSKGNVVPTDNVVTAPDGSQTGSTVADNTTSANHQLSYAVSVTSGQTYFLSGYGQAGTLGFSQLTFQSTQFSGLGYVNVNLTTCSVSASGGTFVSVGAVLDRGWCRYWISATATATGTANAFVIMITNGSAPRSQSYAGTGSTINLWGYQVESATYATQTTPGPYVPTTSAAATSTAQLRQANGTGLLVEEARTNLLIRSNSFSSFSNGSGVTFAQDLTDPALNASSGWTLTQSGANTSDSRAQQNTTVANDGTAYTISVYIKTKASAPAAYPALQAQLVGGTSVAGVVVVDPVTCNKVSNGSITNVAVTWAGSAYCRVSFTITNNTTGNVTLTYQLYPAWASTLTASQSTVNGGSNGFAFGQVEARAFPTSYCPTTSAAVTCNQDQITAAGALLSAMQSTTGTVLGATYGLNLNGGSRLYTTTNNTSLLFNSTTGGQFSDGAASLLTSFGVGNTGASARIVGAHDATSASIAVNGGTVATGAFAYNVGVGVFIGNLQSTWNRALNGYLTRLDVWPQRLPDSILPLATTPQPVLVTDFANSIYRWNGYDLGAAALPSLFSVANSGGYCTTSAGLLVSFPSNTLRICSGTGALPEDTRTNIVKNSQAFTTTNWAPANTTPTDNQITAPDGTLTGGLSVENTTTNSHNLGSTTNVASASTVYTVSAYYKRRDFDWVQLVANDGFAQAFANANLSNCTLGNTGGGVTAASVASVGNGWCRASLTFTTNASAAQILHRNYASRTTGNVASSAPNYTGDGVSGYYIWCAQAEVGSFPTSCITTNGSAVQRNFDNIQALGPVLNLLGTQGANSMMAAWQNSQYYASNASVTRQYLAEWSDVGNTRWAMRSSDVGGSNNPNMAIGDGTTVSTITPGGATVFAAGVPLKAAFRWNNTSADAAASVNGLTAVTTARQFGGNLGAPWYLGGSGGNSGNLNTPLGVLQFFPGGLTNSSLQAATQ